ncbi:hypothetical protein [Candidatus Avelusimicrobium alvi]|uniref:hypothetical protein n=1 Tax=Candidatus Avelusimicrobium alvi TaxID=3416221 RepID=UPI003D114743
MRIWLACVCCLLVGASSAQAQWLKNLGGLMRGLRGAEVQALTMTQKRAAAAAVQREVALGRIAAGTVQTHSLKRMLYGYHLTAARHFPQLAAKPAAEASNAVEELVLSLPVFVKEENILISQIPGIRKPYDVYIQALMTDSWGNWLESRTAAADAAVPVPAVSRRDLKSARALHKDMTARFNEMYAALPAEDKNLSAQFSRVMLNMEQATNWDVQTMDNLRHYFGNILKPYIEKQAGLTPRELLHAYDILAVANMMTERFKVRTQRGLATAPIFLLNESLQRVSRLVHTGLPPASGSARENFLRRWYQNLAK